MTVLSVANEINNNVLFELGSELSCNLEDIADVLDAVGINVENWSIYCLGNISGVPIASGLLNFLCHSNLVA